MVARSHGRYADGLAFVSTAAKTSADAKPAKRPRFPHVRAPKPLLSSEAERQLTSRQRELLDELEARVTEEGMTERTMAEVAAHMNCSLRTLYGIASSKDELLRVVVDRRLRRVGREALDSLDASMSPLEMLRTYLAATNEAVQPTRVTLGRALQGVAGAGHMFGGHGDYVVAMTQHLLEQAIAVGEIEPLDTGALAHVLGALGTEFSKSEVAEVMPGLPKVNADAVADIILRGLPRRAKRRG